MTRGLQQSGFAVERAADGEDGEHLGRDQNYDAVILDLGLPQKSGLEVLEAWRNSGVATPVLILTAQGAWSDKVEGLNKGADDYLTKPFHLPELVARLNALLRRGASSGSLMTHGDLVLNTATSEVTLDGEPLDLTAQEYRMLRYFMHRPRHIVSQSELVEHLYNLDDTRESNTVEVYVLSLIHI